MHRKPQPDPFGGAVRGRQVKEISSTGGPRDVTISYTIFWPSFFVPPASAGQEHGGTTFFFSNEN